MEVILDSGAFSAWTQGVSIDREKYADYILDNLDNYAYIVNLDCIPSVPGDKNLTAEKVELAASTGWDNLEYLLSRGVPKHRLLPVFHQGEDFYWLEKMRDAEFPYIGISPGNDRKNNERIAWLEECTYYVTDSAGLPYMKTHGFAATGFEIIPAFPWYSVDSISYNLIGGFGNMFLPSVENGEWNFKNLPNLFSVSNIERDGKAKCARYYDRMGDSEILDEQVYKYLEYLGIPFGESTFRKEPVGYKAKKDLGEVVHKDKKGTGFVTVETRVVKGAHNDAITRALVNAMYYGHFENTQPAFPVPFKQKTHHFRLNTKAARCARKSDITGDGTPIRLYYAGLPGYMNRFRRKFLDFFGRDQFRQLISYHYIKNCETVVRQLKEWDNETIG